MKKIEKQNGDFIIALARSLQIIHRKSDVLFRQHNLTMAQFTVLEALLHKGEMSIGALICSVLSSSGNMSVVVRNLEKQCLIHRREHPEDRRSMLISLTKDGEKLIRNVFAQHMSLVEESLTPLSTLDKENVLSILNKLR